MPGRNINCLSNWIIFGIKADKLIIYGYGFTIYANILTMSDNWSRVAAYHDLKNTTFCHKSKNCYLTKKHDIIIMSYEMPRISIGVLNLMWWITYIWYVFKPLFSKIDLPS